MKRTPRREFQSSASKTKKRGRTQRPSIAPWIILAISLAVIGFACSRTGPASRAPSTAVHPAPTATRAATRNEPIGASTPVATPKLVTPSATPATPESPSPSASASGQPPTTPPATATPTPIELRTPFGPPKSAPRLALIIDDCGQWLDTERGFIALPIALTLSVLPDVPFNHTIEREAIDANKGVMLHLPMETLSGLNPGPGKITTEMDDAAIAVQVQDDLANVDLARGVNNHEGSKATANARVMNDLMTVLAQRGQFFIDSRTNGASVAERVAAQHGVATAGRDVFLDNRADVEYTEGQLKIAAAIAKRDGSAIAIGHPRPTTLAAVRAMIPELQADGIVFSLAQNLTH